MSLEFRLLGRSGVQVSTLCLGTMNFGGVTAEAEAKDIIAAADAAGVNFIDTADVYNAGESERIVGRAIKARRDHWFLATKAGNQMGEGINRRGASRRWLYTAVDDSLSRLGTDWIDLYYLHRDDPMTPLDETVSALGNLIAAGKIRYFGVSNFRSWRVAEIATICDRLGVPRPVASQPYYNALNRMPEAEHLPACDHFGLGVVPYSPNARGVLSGKYLPGEAPPDDSRAGRADARIMQTEWRRESLVIAARLKAHAADRGLTPSQFAVLWVLRNKLVAAAIVGPRTLPQMTDYLGIAGRALTAEDEALVDHFVTTGHPSTPGYNDPAYPLTGRRV